MTVKIDLNKARELLKAAVETQGADFKYVSRVNQGCAYTPINDENYGSYLSAPPAKDDPRRKTGCVVGTALTAAGVDWSKIDQRYRINYLYNNRAFADQEVELEEDAMLYFLKAQYAQDTGNTWGKALERAEAFAENELNV